MAEMSGNDVLAALASSGPTEEKVELISRPADRSRTGVSKHALILFGHGNTQADMGRWFETIKASNLARDHAIWNVSYDWRKPFTAAGDALYHSLQNEVAKHGDSFGQVRMICYSMGGLVGRRLVQHGMPCTRLASIASPHLGLMDYIPANFPGLSTDGVRSLKKGSSQLREINSDPRDAAARSGYFFAGISYRVINPLGNWYHDDDQVVEVASALANGLAGVGHRRRYEIPYTGGIAPEIGAPHKYPPLDPRYFPDVMKFLCS